MQHPARLSGFEIDICLTGIRSHKGETVGVANDAPRDQFHAPRHAETACAIFDQLPVTNHRAQAPAQAFNGLFIPQQAEHIGERWQRQRRIGRL